MDTKEVVIQVIAKATKKDPSEIHEGLHLHKDLKFKGFDVFGLLFAIAEKIKFHIDLNDESIKIDTVGDLINVVEANKK